MFMISAGESQPQATLLHFICLQQNVSCPTTEINDLCQTASDFQFTLSLVGTLVPVANALPVLGGMDIWCADECWESQNAVCHIIVQAKLCLLIIFWVFSFFILLICLFLPLKLHVHAWLS